VRYTTKDLDRSPWERSLGCPRVPRNLFESMIGATIVDVGKLPGVREGGFTVDYLRPGQQQVERVVLGYTDLGEWIEWNGPVPEKQPPGSDLENHILTMGSQDQDALHGTPRGLADSPMERSLGFYLGDYVVTITVGDYRRTNTPMTLRWGDRQVIEPIPEEPENRVAWWDLLVETCLSNFS
jgi:hypothetical protein